MKIRWKEAIADNVKEVNKLRGDLAILKAEYRLYCGQVNSLSERVDKMVDGQLAQDHRLDRMFNDLIGLRDANRSLQDKFELRVYCDELHQEKELTSDPREYIVEYEDAHSAASNIVTADDVYVVEDRTLFSYKGEIVLAVHNNHLIAYRVKDA